MAADATRTVTCSTGTVDNSGSPSSGGLDAALNSMMEKSLRSQLFRSLSKIRRHLSRRDPQGLRRIRNWYSGASSEHGNVGELSQEQLSSSNGEEKVELQRKLNFRQRRMEQNEIDGAMLKYLKIPKGVATRGLVVPPQPAWLFSDDPPPPQLLSACPEALQAPPMLEEFCWLPLNSNTSNTENTLRRSTEHERIRQKLGRWVFLFFRVPRRNWESTVVEEKKAASDVNMYAEEHLQKWTIRLRFKILRHVPVKVALCAFMSRLGLESNAHIVFCVDGFYGLMDVGNIYGELTKTPSAMISLNSTPRYLGLKNGDSIFVNSCSVSQRQMMEEAPRTDEPKRRRSSALWEEGGDSDGEEGDFDFNFDADDDVFQDQPDPEL